MKFFTVLPLFGLLVVTGCSAEQQLPTAPAAVSAKSFSSGSAAKTQAMVELTICHKPGSSARQTLTLPDPALPAHMQHGDILGACGLPPGATACPIARIVVGPPLQATLTFQDTGPGLLYLTLVQSLSTNANVIIPAFDPATAAAVVITATRINPAQQATFVILVKIETESTSSALPCSYEL